MKESIYGERRFWVVRCRRSVDEFSVKDLMHSMHRNKNLSRIVGRDRAMAEKEL